MTQMMDFGTAIATCFRKFVTFSGRAPRAEYWWFILATSVVSFGLSAIREAVSIGFDVLTILPTLAVSWRRLHDVGKTGLWNLGLVLWLPYFIDPVWGGYGTALTVMMVVGIVISIYVFVLTLTPGETGANEYGDDPYGTGVDAAVFD